LEWQHLPIILTDDGIKVCKNYGGKIFEFGVWQGSFIIFFPEFCTQKKLKLGKQNADFSAKIS